MTKNEFDPYNCSEEEWGCGVEFDGGRSEKGKVEEQSEGEELTEEDEKDEGGEGDK